MIVMLAAAVLALLGLAILATYRLDRLAALVGVVVTSGLILVPAFYSGGMGNAVLLAIAGATAILLLRREPQPDQVRGSWLYGLYFAVIAAATVVHSGVSQLSSLLSYALPGLAGLLIILYASAGERAIVMRWLVGASLLEAVYAVGQVAGLLPRLWGNVVYYEHQLLAGFPRGEGTLGHPLMLALLLVIAIAITLSSKVSGAKRLFVLLTLFAGLFASGSRAGLLVAVVLLLFSARGGRVKRFTIGALLTATIVVALTSNGFFSGALVGNFLTGASVGHRSGAVEAIPRLLSQPFVNVFLGNGAGSIDSLFRRGLLQSGGFHAVDNQFVTTLAIGGLVGLAALAVLLLRILAIGRETRIVTVAAVMFCLTFDLLVWPAGAALFGIVIGLAHVGKPTKFSADARAPLSAELADVSRR